MSVIGARHSLRYFLRKRFALAIARRSHGASTEVSVALLEMTFEADIAAAAAFSLSILWYSAGEHLFCAISNVRRVMSPKMPAAFRPS